MKNAIFFAVAGAVINASGTSFSDQPIKALVLLLVLAAAHVLTE